MDLNDTVTVTLTKRGAEILNKDARRLNLVFRKILNKHDYKEGDNYKGSLWMMFEKFGEYCSAGSEAVFKNLRRAIK